ncbi:MAG TPA: hypothetical protein VGH10_04855 [Actinomycetota bacterium]
MPVAALIAHSGIPGSGPFLATGLFLAGAGAAFGAYTMKDADDPLRRRTGIGLRVVAGGCLLVATAIPFVIRPGPAFHRPSTAAHLTIVSPRAGQVYSGNPALVPVRLTLAGGKVVPLTSLHLVPNEGHIHLYLDGKLVQMTGLEAEISAVPGSHTLLAEFVAIDHLSFEPRVLASVRFDVRG